MSVKLAENFLLHPGKVIESPTLLSDRYSLRDGGNARSNTDFGCFGRLPGNHLG